MSLFIDPRLSKSNIVKSNTPPENKQVLWVDTSSTPLVMKVYDEITQQWQIIAGGSDGGSGEHPIIIVQNISERDALTPYQGLRVFVIDASDDDTINEGYAEYIYFNNEWIKLSEKESLDLLHNSLEGLQGGDPSTNTYLHLSDEDKEKYDGYEQQIGELDEKIDDSYQDIEKIKKDLYSENFKPEIGEPFPSTKLLLEPIPQKIRIPIGYFNDVPILDESKISVNPDVLNNIALEEFPLNSGNWFLIVEILPEPNQKITLTIDEESIYFHKETNEEKSFVYFIKDNSEGWEEEFILPNARNYIDASELNNEINDVLWYGEDFVGGKISVKYLGRVGNLLDTQIDVPLLGINDHQISSHNPDGSVYYDSVVNRIVFERASIGDKIYKIVKS